MTAAAMDDEHRPLLGPYAERLDRDASQHQLPREWDDDHVLDFDPSGDADNPMEWPAAFKWSIVALLAFMAFTVYVDQRRAGCLPRRPS